MNQELIPAEAKELETILEKYFSGTDKTISKLDSVKAVHRISVYNDGAYFAVSMYAREIDMSKIAEIEQVHGYKLQKINMQSAALFFGKVPTKVQSFTNGKGLKVQLHPENKNVIATVEVPTIRGAEYTKHIQVVKRKVDNTYFYVSHEIKGAGGVFATYRDLQKNYAALRQISEIEFLERIK